MWQAKFKNGVVVDEIEMKDGQEVENSFKLVMDNLEDLVSLSIIQGTKMYSVSMNTGEFTVITSGIPFNFHAINLETVTSGKMTNIRPIYFVREFVLFQQYGAGTSPGSPPHLLFTALGFQSNVDGANIKRYLAIQPDGTFTIEDK